MPPSSHSPKQLQLARRLCLTPRQKFSIFNIQLSRSLHVPISSSSRRKYMRGFSGPALGVAHLIFAQIPVQGKLENAFSLCSKKEGEKRLVIGWQSLPKKGRLEVKLSPGLKRRRLGTLTFRRCLALSPQSLSTNSGKTVFQRTYRMSGLEKHF